MTLNRQKISLDIIDRALKYAYRAYLAAAKDARARLRLGRLYTVSGACLTPKNRMMV